ncbi:hypothetical protein ACFLYE_02545, partial [Chloroflexota bacterium]
MNKPLKLFGAVLILIFILVLALSACEPGGYPIIDNQRNEEVTIRISDVYEDGRLSKPIDYGVVPAQTTKKLAGLAF